MIAGKRLMTAEDLLNLPDDGQRHELVRGELRTMAPRANEQGWVTMNVSGPLWMFVSDRRLGVVFTAGTECKLAENPDTVLAPDVSFYSRERAVRQRPRRGFRSGAPDLVVEIISPNDRYVDVEAKVAEWLASGVRMLILVNPRRREVRVYRPAQSVQVLTAADVLEGADVVPGWRLPVAAIFRDPLGD